MPAVFITYSLAYVDRANYGFGAAAGLADTLHITGSQTALLGSLFFLGYFLFQIPGASYARRRSATRLVCFSLISWGLFASLTGVIRNFWLLAADRLLLGVAESLILPAMITLLTHWFTREERSRANTLLILGNPVTVLWMSAITGYLIHAFGWQMTFILEGVPSIVWAFIWLATARDRPADAPWLTSAAARSLEERLAQEQTALPKIANVGAALVRPEVLLLSLQYFCWSVGVYGFVLWLPETIRMGASVGIEATGLLSAVPYLLAILLMIAVSWLSDRTLRRAGLIWPALVLSGIALLSSYLLSGHDFWLAYCGLVVAGGMMYAPYGPFFAIIPEIVPKNVAAEVVAAVNSSGALGAFVGSWLVGLLQAKTGSPRDGFLLMSVSLVLSGMLILLLPRKKPLDDGLSSAQLAELH
ncbi:MFS transporter [Acidipila sp. 4G-K13]|uniref:MFS transporter n=2 Tax=Paracidobacterium acidisoli TaxID=2303751 RepID=A0A372ISU1_9BACT|nr:MFS transporter [Paracidobacterium acidisoli]